MRKQVKIKLKFCSVNTLMHWQKHVVNTFKFTSKCVQFRFETCSDEGNMETPDKKGQTLCILCLS